jgi:hypothetical protein
MVVVVTNKESEILAVIATHIVCSILVIGPSILVYILIENQQMHHMTTLL